MTIPSRSDKIAPVADDGALKSRRKPCQPETRRRNSRGQESGTKGSGSVGKQMKKLLTTPCRCDNLYRLSLEADREGSRKGRQKKMKKFLTKRKRFDKISKLSREKNDRNLDN